MLQRIANKIIPTIMKAFEVKILSKKQKTLENKDEKNYFKSKIKPIKVKKFMFKKENDIT